MNPTNRHDLVRLEVMGNERLRAIGIEAECSCGWKSGPRFSKFVAEALFIDHQERGTGRDAVPLLKDPKP